MLWFMLIIVDALFTSVMFAVKYVHRLLHVSIKITPG